MDKIHFVLKRVTQRQRVRDYFTQKLSDILSLSLPLPILRVVCCDKCCCIISLLCSSLTRRNMMFISLQKRQQLKVFHFKKSLLLLYSGRNERKKTHFLKKLFLRSGEWKKCCDIFIEITMMMMSFYMF